MRHKRTQGDIEETQSLNLFRKPLRGALKVVNYANLKRSKKRISPACFRSETFDIAVDMFNFHPAFGNLTVEFLFFFGQLMIFRRLEGNRTVYVKFCGIYKLHEL